MINGVPRLKRDYKKGYYAQVQGQLPLSGLLWCDFVVYLSGSHTLCVERIYFDADYCNSTLLPKLTSFYFKHAIAFLGKKKLCNRKNLAILETYQSALCTKVMTLSLLIFAYLYIFISVQMPKALVKRLMIVDDSR